MLKIGDLIGNRRLVEDYEWVQRRAEHNLPPAQKFMSYPVGIVIGTYEGFCAVMWCDHGERALHIKTEDIVVLAWASGR